MKQSMNSVFSCYHELSNIPFFSFFFWDKDVATCNPFTQRLPTIECLLLFADTLKLLSSLIVVHGGSSGTASAMNDNQMKNVLSRMGSEKRSTRN